MWTICGLPWKSTSAVSFSTQRSEIRLLELLVGRIVGRFPVGRMRSIAHSFSIRVCTGAETCRSGPMQLRHSTSTGKEAASIIIEFYPFGLLAWEARHRARQRDAQPQIIEVTAFTRRVATQECAPAATLLSWGRRGVDAD